MLPLTMYLDVWHIKEEEEEEEEEEEGAKSLEGCSFDSTDDLCEDC